MAKKHCRECRLDPIGHAGFHCEPIVDVTKKCRECMNLGSSHATDCPLRPPPVSPFPPEVVERAKAKDPWGDIADHAISVIADYLRSEEARVVARAALCDHYTVVDYDSHGAADAVIAALLGEKL